MAWSVLVLKEVPGIWYILQYKNIVYIENAKLSSAFTRYHWRNPPDSLETQEHKNLFVNFVVGMSLPLFHCVAMWWLDSLYVFYMVCAGISVPSSTLGFEVWFAPAPLFNQKSPNLHQTHAGQDKFDKADVASHLRGHRTTHQLSTLVIQKHCQFTMCHNASTEPVLTYRNQVMFVVVSGAFAYVYCMLHCVPSPCESETP